MTVPTTRDTGLDEPRSGSDALSLELGTQLAGYSVKYWPGAGELVVFPTRMRAKSPSRRDPLAPEADPPTPEQRAEHIARAARRAKSRVRRRAVHYDLGIMWTLTFGRSSPSDELQACGPLDERGCWSEAEADSPTTEPSEGGRHPGLCSCGRPRGLEGLRFSMRATAAFVKRLRADLYAGVAFPYVYVPEFHEDGHVHVHLLLRDFVPFGLMTSTWGHGFVAFTDFRKRRQGQARGAAGKRSARYVTKYIAKTFAEDFGQAASGLHRYEVAQGFDPTSVTTGGYRTRTQALRFVLDSYGVDLEHACWAEDCDPDTGVPWLWASVSTLAAAVRL